MTEPAGIGAEISAGAWRELAATGPTFFLIDDARRDFGVPVTRIGSPAEAPADESTYSVTFIGAETREAYDATEGADGSDALTLAEVIGRCESYAVRAQLRDAAGFSKGFVSADGTYTLT